MPATMRASYYGGSASEPAGLNAETGIKFSRDDNQNTGGTPVPIPTAGGPGATNYSWPKNLALEVTAAAAPATAITNRTVRLATAPAAGLQMHWKTGAYVQPSNGVMPAANASANDAVPAGYTQMTTTATQYDNTSVSGASTGRNGQMVQAVLGVSFNYAGGAGSATALPNMIVAYDEA